jgi:nitronate monooxygenase
MAMTIGKLRESVTVPVIAAPMLLVSGARLTIECCKAGVVGSYPMANSRTAEECDAVMAQIHEELEQARAQDPARKIAPYAINIVVFSEGNDRLESNIALLEKYQVPVVITSVGDPRPVVDRVHAYGGLVIHDVATLKHARKAIEAGVDGLILLTSGAGGHTGSMNPFTFVEQIRGMWDGAILLAGGISEGRSVRAAEVLGADFAYMGTRFIATQESAAPEPYKQLLVSQESADVMITERISGHTATFMRGSISAAGLDPDNLPERKGLFQPNLPDGIKAWRDVWSAGQGVGSIKDLPTVSALVERLAAEYQRAL